MSSTGTPVTTVTLEDGTFAVVRTDPHKPELLEMIAIFFDAARARDYADIETAALLAPTEPTEAPTRPAVEPPASAADLGAAPERGARGAPFKDGCE